MKQSLSFFLFSAILVTCLGSASAVELLTSGDFESPGGGEIPSWTLQEFASDTLEPLNTAQLIGFSPLSGTNELWLRSFAGGGTVGPNNKTTAILSQTVAALPGTMYTFTGNARWEENYSGGLTDLTTGPLAGQMSPTETNMRLEFLDSSGGVLDFVEQDLRDTTTNFNFYTEQNLNGLSPAGTASIRVTAEAIDMVSTGGSQSAFYDLFSLTGANDPTTEMLGNPDLEEAPPSALDFWTLTENPPERMDIVRTAGFANHTPGGSLGVWMSAFFGQSSIFEPEPVDGALSQTVEGIPGGSYTFSGWTRFEANYSGGVDTIDPANPDGFGGQASPTETFLELAFLDGTGSVLESHMVDVKADRRLQSPTMNANDNEWYQHTISDKIAPGGTVEVRVSGVMMDGVFNVDPGQSAFFDDFSLDGPSTGGPTCDLTGDGMCGLPDINALYDEIFAGTNSPAFDFNGDGMVNNDDIGGWLASAGTENSQTYVAGDADLNGAVGGGDFTTLASNFGNSNADPAAGPAYWGNGNFDGNAGSAFGVGGSDFTALASNFGFTSVAAVPEPSGLALCAICLGLIPLWRRRRSA